MPSKRLFLDIRYYESDCENIDGSSLPSNLGRIYNFPKSIHSLGARIARKLREYEFVAGTYDHLYVNFTTVIEEGQIKFSPRDVLGWVRYIDYGLPKAQFNGLADAEKELQVFRKTIDILRFIAGDDLARQAVIDRVESEIGAKGTEIEIVLKKKETTAYFVSVSYQIRPNGNQSVGLIEFHDKKSGVRRRVEFVKLFYYEDIFALVGTISISQGVITLKPRSSFKASLFTQRYQVPIEIQVANMKVI